MPSRSGAFLSTLFCLLLLKNATSTAGSTPVLKLLSLSDVPIYNHATFTCTVAGSLTITEWRKDRFIIDKIDSHYTFNSDFSELKIEIVEASDAGDYSCSAEDAGKNAHMSNSVPLRVLVQPKITPTDAITYGCTGSSITLSCSGTHISHVWWLFGGTKIRDQPPYQMSGNENQNLDITPLTPADAGKYTCKGINQYPSLASSATQTLIIESPPKILRGPQSETFLTGYDINLFCNVSAFPLPYIYWKKDGVFVETLGKRFLVGYKTGTLFIANAKKSDEGQYTCYANSILKCNLRTVAVESAKAFVQIDDIGTLPFYRPTLYKTVALGSMATIRCSANRSVSESIAWIRQGQPVQTTRNIFISSDGKMMIKQATYNLSGTYECHFTGQSLPSHVKLIQTVKITVRGPPAAPRLTDATVIIAGTIPSATLSWTTPFDGNSPILGYTVYYRLIGDSQWLDHSVRGLVTTTSFSFSGLAGVQFYATAYNFQNNSEKSNVIQVNLDEFKFFPNFIAINESAVTDGSYETDLFVSVTASPTSNNSTTIKRQDTSWHIIAYCVSGTAIFAIPFAVLFVCIRRRRRSYATNSKPEVHRLPNRRESKEELISRQPSNTSRDRRSSINPQDVGKIQEEHDGRYIGNDELFDSFSPAEETPRKAYYDKTDDFQADYPQPTESDV